MYAIRRHREPGPGASRTVRVEGSELGGPVSLFLVQAEPGRGSGLHRHPYQETWIIRKGEAEFTVDGERMRAGAGDIVVGPADLPHRYLNVGNGDLEMVCVHPNAVILQEDLTEQADGTPG